MPSFEAMAKVTRRRARRGALAVMDAEVPGWVDRINQETLDLSDCTLCVLGQSLGDFNDGLDMIRREDCSNIDFRKYQRRWRWAVRNGFAAYGEDLFGVLDAAWREEIAERRALAAHVAETAPETEAATC